MFEVFTDFTQTAVFKVGGRINYALDALLDRSRIEVALMLFLNECTKPARGQSLPAHTLKLHTHTQYIVCFHVDLSVYNVFIVHPKEQCGNVNQATQMYYYNVEVRNV